MASSTMALPAPNIGDILMLSHLCWKIGTAFSAGRKGAPIEFTNIEKELRSLTTSITMLAEALDEEDCILARCDVRARKGLNIIIDCCSQSLNNLEAFVSQYQDIKMTGQSGTMSVQGSWRKILIKHWQTIAWTTDGGGIQSLRSMLSMHTQSITLVLNALQSHSPRRVEDTIEPMADQVEKIYGNLVEGNMDIKLQQTHAIVSELQSGKTPANWQRRPVEGRSHTASRRQPQYHHKTTPGCSPQIEPLTNVYDELYDQQMQTAAFLDPNVKTPELSDSEIANSPPMTQGSFPSGLNNKSYRGSEQHPPEMVYRLEQPNVDSFGRKLSEQSQGSQGLGVSPVRPFHLVTNQMAGLSLRLPPPALDHSSERELNHSPGESRQSSVVSPLTEYGSHSWMSRSASGRVNYGAGAPSTPRRSLSSRAVSPPTIGSLSPAEGLQPTGGSYYDHGSINENPDSIEYSLAVTAANEAEPRASNTDDQEIATPEQQRIFEHSLLTNSLVACEVTTNSVDYTVPNEEKYGDFLMQNACGKCKVYVITRSSKISNGKTRYLTSVWVLSDDRKTRLEIALPEDNAIIPYTVWASPHRPVIRDDVRITYYGPSLDEKPLSIHATNWVTFTFDVDTPNSQSMPPTPADPAPSIHTPGANSADQSTTFQNALMEKQILLSVRTKRTMRLFEGVKGQFSFAEQLCGLENLRVVLDPPSGIISAWLHYSPTFSQGWLVFSLNVSQETIRVREEDDKIIRVKGLKVPVGERDKRTGGRRPSEPYAADADDADRNQARKKKKQEWVAGAKIEFSASADKKAFMSLLKDVQDRGARG